MTWPDYINGAYECLGGFFIYLSIRKLRKDKKVHGISWAHAFFFTSWGYWNLFYYPHLEQWMSFVGGVLIVITNTIWMGQLVYYTYKMKQEQHG